MSDEEENVALEIEAFERNLDRQGINSNYSVSLPSIFNLYLHIPSCI